MTSNGLSRIRQKPASSSDWTSAMIRRVPLLLVLIAWVAAVHWYWANFVPLPATDSISPSAGLQFQGTTRDGLIAFASRTEAWGATGPIRFRDPGNHQWVRESLSAQDRVIQVVLGERELAAVLRDDAVAIIDLGNGSTLVSRPTGGRRLSATLSPNGHMAAFFGVDEVSVFDTRSAALLWTSGVVPHQSGGGFQGDHRFHVSHDERGRGVIEFRDARDWTVDSRYDGGGLQVISDDSRYAVFQARDGSQAVYDYETGQRLWQIRPAGSYTRFDGFGERFQFCKGGSEVWSIAEDGKSRPRLTRWSSETGEQRQTCALAERDVRNPAVSRDGRYLVFQVDRPAFEAPQWAVSLANRLGSSWTGAVGDARTTIVIADADSGDSIGFIESFENRMDDSMLSGIDPSMEGFAVAPRGFVVASPAGWTRYFELPPRHDWTWLALWSSCPPAGLWLAARYRRLRLNAASTRKKTPPDGGLPPGGV
jgi:hypothetical protein